MAFLPLCSSACTLLVAGDEAAFPAYLRDGLTKLGYHICDRDDRGESVKEQVLRLRPNVVLMVVHPGGATADSEVGSGLARELDVPFVVFPTSSQPLEKEPEPRLSGSDRPENPLREADLHAAIQVTLCRHQMERRLEAAEARVEETVRERTSELAPQPARVESTRGESSAIASSEHGPMGPGVLANLINFLPGMVGHWTSDLICDLANGEYLSWFGRTPEQMHGAQMRDVLGDALFSLNEPYIRAVLAGEPQHFERSITKPDGSVGDTWAHYIPDRVGDRVVGFYVLVTDVTPIKQTQRTLQALQHKLREREAMLSSIHANLPGTCVYRVIRPPEGPSACTYVSPNVEGLLGLSEAEFMADPSQILGLIHPEDLPGLQAVASASVRDGTSYAHAVRLRHSGKGDRWVQFGSCQVERRPDGTQVRDGVMVDISSVMAAESEMRKMALIVAHTDNGYVVCQPTRWKMIGKKCDGYKAW